MIVLTVCVAVGAIGLLAVLRSQSAVSVSQLIAHLPATDSTLVSIDVGSLRRAGLLEMVAGSPAAEDADFRAFVTETGFDYRQDLDSVLLSVRPDTTHLMAQGRFDWDRLSGYAQRQRGTCWNGFCRLAASQPDRTISFFPLKPGVLALAVAADPWEVQKLADSRPRAQLRIPSQPVWISLPASVLNRTETLPEGTRAFASAMRGIDRVVLSGGPDQGRFQISMEATCATADEAVRVARELESATATLRKMIAREKKTPNPGDLSGVLTAGVFEHAGRQVQGRWPVERAFLETLAGAGR